MPLRAWEFIAGGAIYFLAPALRKLHRWQLDVVGVAGIACVTIAVLKYSAATPFPSYTAVLPVAGACAIIAAGCGSERTITVRIMAFQPFVFIGLISYGWYLWHWPLLAFGRIYHFGEHNLPFDLTMAAVAFLLAVATRYLVELPILKWRRSLRHGWRPVIIGITACLAAALVGNIAVAAISGVNTTLSEAIFEADTALDRNCNLSLATSAEPCIGNSTGPVGLLIGDSQAEAVWPYLARALADQDSPLLVLAGGGCAPILGVRVFMRDQAMSTRCVQRKVNFAKLVDADKIHPDFAIIIARWQIYADGSYRLGELASNEPSEDQKAMFADRLSGTLDTLASIGVKRILLIGAFPEFPRSPPECLARAHHYGISSAEWCAPARQSVEARTAKVNEWIGNAIKGRPSVRYIKPASHICGGEDRCLPSVNGAVLFRDGTHLSGEGVNYLIGSYRADWEWLTNAHSQAMIEWPRPPLLH